MSDLIVSTEEMVTITKQEYRRLLKNSLELARLGAHGVDNWSGYSWQDGDEDYELENEDIT